MDIPYSLWYKLDHQVKNLLRFRNGFIKPTMKIPPHFRFADRTVIIIIKDYQTEEGILRKSQAADLRYIEKYAPEVLTIFKEHLVRFNTIFDNIDKHTGLKI